MPCQNFMTIIGKDPEKKGGSVMWTGITREELLELGGLDIMQVRDGFERYESAVISGSSEKIELFLQRCLHMNGESAYVDFYYYALAEDERERFWSELSEDEKRILPCFGYEKNSIYYPLTDKNLKFFADVTAKCRLFSTFWYLKYPAVIWGNYDLKYPVFFKGMEEMELYREMAEKCGLEFIR